MVRTPLPAAWPATQPRPARALASGPRGSLTVKGCLPASLLSGEVFMTQ
jgi:hypothetical protein